MFVAAAAAAATAAADTDSYVTHLIKAYCVYQVGYLTAY